MYTVGQRLGPEGPCQQPRERCVDKVQGERVARGGRAVHDDGPASQERREEATLANAANVPHLRRSEGSIDPWCHKPVAKLDVSAKLQGERVARGATSLHEEQMVP
mmetsp:Transcript_84254/g.235106  ORF Transcript_84254/g.235106 Transcript_84254/m.235106 type:complete len:106 (-) Transcript_84254:809-1126(-)